MKKSYIILTLLLTFCIISVPSWSQVLETKNLSLEREYEVVLLTGLAFPQFNDVSVGQLFLYAFHQGTGWQPIPFQIDEVDPVYGAPTDGKFDANDEILFLAQDLGDRVTLGNWINNVDAQSQTRYEIEVVDPLNQSKKGWCYLFRSATLTETDKNTTKYLAYKTVNDSVIVEGKYYKTGYGKNWYPKDILITTEGGGNGQDMYDRTKLRIRAFPTPVTDIWLNEESITIEKNLYTIKGPIRIQIRDSLKFNIPDVNYGATFTRKFFPYFTNFHGNVELQPLWQFKVLRMSYDLNPAVSGMKFHSGDSSGVKNSNITIDGQSDEASIDLTIKENSPNWTMTTGTHGTMLTINSVNFEKDPTVTEPYTQKVYYWDDATGAKLPIGSDIDTGDNFSYGDHGMIFRSDALVGVVTYTSETFLLPANQTIDFAQTMFYNFNNSLQTWAVRAQEYMIDVSLKADNGLPQTYRLNPNYPNPFNPATTISFEIPQADFVSLQIFDIQGKYITTLVNKKLAAGVYNYVWNGKDEAGNEVSTGIYIYKIQTDHFRASQKMVFVK